MDAVGICNLALGRLGEPSIISFDDNDESARTCKKFFAPIRDEVLRAHPWNFAGHRVELSELADAPLFGWDHQYQLPGDYLAMRQLNGWKHFEALGKWSIEGDRLLTNADSAQVLYTRRITDASLFDSSFVGALKVRLAAEMAHTITGSQKDGQDLMREYLGILKPLAELVNAAEERPDPKPAWLESDLVNSRFGI